MFRRHSGKSKNPIYMVFRLILSLVMFAILLGGIYAAYKHFSGLDPLKLDPQAVFSNILKAKTPQQFLLALSSIKVPQSLSNQINQKISDRNNDKNILQDLTKQSGSGKVAFKFLLVADSHSDNANLQKAINQAKQGNPDLAFIIGLGDYTEVGTLDELKKAKTEFDLAGLRYFLTAGDHDLWDSRDKQKDPGANFREIFGPTYQSFTYENFRFLILFNSDNYLGISDEQKNWLNLELEKAKSDQALGIFVFVHEPFFHPSSDHIMGRVESSLKEEARNIVRKLKDFDVKKVFAGDTHYFSEYSESETNLSMVTVGAITIERNPQAPRYAVVTVFEDGNTGVEDIAIK